MNLAKKIVGKKEVSTSSLCGIFEYIPDSFDGRGIK